jgi:hypothetical protein
LEISVLPVTSSWAESCRRLLVSPDGKYVFGAAHRDICRVTAAILEPPGANAL